MICFTCTGLWVRARKQIFLKKLLFVFSFFYWCTLQLREKLYKAGLLRSFRPSLFTICVGNITTGGSGKTPTVLYITDNLREDYSPGILSRGYRSNPGSFPHLVSKNDSPLTAGDEALLLASMLPENIPLVISPDRQNGIRCLQDHPTDLCIMDDGLQHLRIHPHLKLCLIDLSDAHEYLDASSYSVIPGGIFREDPFAGLRKADRAVFISKIKLTDALKALVLQIASKYGLVSYSILEILPDGIRDGFTWKLAEDTEYQQYTLLSSIAKPESFQDSVRELQITFDTHIIREDHHQFHRDEWLEILRHSKHRILCTAKDWIKIRPYLTKENDVLVLTQSVHDRSTEREKLIPWIREQIKKG
jgi:tetraacyldisaccharide 4'-kinase